MNGTPASEAAARTTAAAPRDQLKPWHFFVLASLLSATAAVVMTRQARPESLVLISLTIGGAGFAAAALYRTLIPLVSSEAAPASGGALAEGLRASLEREKMLALRSLKELEFDRAMGKVSPKDFEEMAGRLRARAMSLMRQLDSGGAAYRELIERELSARLTGQTSSARLKGVSTGGASAAGSDRACACGTLNDVDAAFCKRCGTRLSRVSEA